jgi:hypothetical protein
MLPFLTVTCRQRRRLENDRKGLPEARPARLLPVASGGEANHTFGRSEMQRYGPGASEIGCSAMNSDLARTRSRSGALYF